MYEVGSLLNLSCESGPSSPPTKLHWFINGVKIGKDEKDETVTDMETVFPLEDKRGISRSLLQYPLSRDNLSRLPPQLVVKCVALIKEFYRKGIKVRVEVKGRKLESATDVRNKTWEGRRGNITTSGTNTTSIFLLMELFLVTFTTLRELCPC